MLGDNSASLGIPAMQSKWRAPACYLGVAVVCAIYLAVVPGISITDICAGAGLGAAVMWAINEWETGKWKVTLPWMAAPAAASVAVPTSAAAGTQPVSESVPAVVADASPRPRGVSSSAAARVARDETPEEWDVDDEEPTWDATALAETWAKLRRELSFKPSLGAAAVAPDLPADARFARAGQIPAAGASGLPRPPHGPFPPYGQSPTTALTGSGGSAAPPPVRPFGGDATAGGRAPLGSLARAYAAGQRSLSGSQGTGFPAGTAGTSLGGVSRLSAAPGRGARTGAAPAASAGSAQAPSGNLGAAGGGAGAPDATASTRRFAAADSRQPNPFLRPR